nr:unnamed protein product [Callosobruchus analis]
MKVRMLSWPFGLGLITAPLSLAAKIRGSLAQNELVLAAIGDLKHLMVSRRETSSILSGDFFDQDSSTSERVARDSRKMSRLDKLEKSHAELKDMISSIIKKPEPPETTSEISIAADPTPIDSEPYSDHSDFEDEVLWSAPDIQHEDEMDVDFSPITKEKEPAIPLPKPHILIQGKECQRLGLSSFNKIRYSEVQKKLQAAPVFSALHVNPQLNFLTSASQDYNAKMDSCLGTISHGLLLQRDAFTNAIKTIVTKHPSAKEDITTHLLKGEFREISDEIIQYTCGRRAEAIELGRKSFYPKNDAIASQLENIPPLETFLFDETQFADFFKLHGRFFRFNTQNHSHAAIGYNKKGKYDYTRRSAYVQIGPRNGNAQKSPSANNFTKPANKNQRKRLQPTQQRHSYKGTTTTNRSRKQ